ncbi:Sec-independent protein translocase protein TatB [Luteibacter sp. PPL201]|uniref:Sec-independent protein translocase protein TatB n=1 Tax=Luteibacter sahnii TaxID=3021977 RepID=A0ABT6BFD7_9GAMM|nr:Sec-independent protein translocase protein TatB [Luteibacter sp. PPL193]MDY1549092.1 Sec-independent protein translocase protein TatB [Luteibacter sp. PPL193]
MIEISFGKLLLLALVALIVLGPERLPHAARTAGALLRRVRNGWDSVRSEVEREIQAEEIRRTLRETAEQARSAHEGVRDDLRVAGDEMRRTGDRMRDTFTDTQAARAATDGTPPAVVPSPDPVPPRTEPHDRT